MLKNQERSWRNAKYPGFSLCQNTNSKPKTFQEIAIKNRLNPDQIKRVYVETPSNCKFTKEVDFLILDIHESKIFTGMDMLNQRGQVQHYLLSVFH